MSKQLHKNFTDGQVKTLLKSYLDKKIKINYILKMLKIKRSRFFELLAKYRKDQDNFSIHYSMNFAEVKIKQKKFFIKTKVESLGNKILKLLRIKPPENLILAGELSLK